MTAASMRALRWDGPGEVHAVDVERPQARDGWAVVDVAYSGLCGTDLHICSGHHPRAVPGLVLGHELSGTLADGTRVVVNPLLSCGHCVTCLAGRPHTCANLRLLGIDAPGGAAEQVAVPVANLVPLPADADLTAAAFAEPLAVAVRAVRRSRLALGEDAVVVGAGPVGLAVALCARQAGAGRVLVVETAPARQEVAARLGLEVAGEHVPDAVAPVVFDCASHPAVAARLGALAAPAGRVVLVGVYPGLTPVDLQAVTFKELEVVGTRVYSRDDLVTAARMITSGAFDPRPLLTRTVTVDEAPAAIDALASGRDVKVLVQGRA
ncbi:MAG TPA: alcohol dehydrogenase catalytic domain-containing protein [Kineosporiaceae bacterium]|nr:alcohol dehydrogenase catalytic domain-containing protein [Kineosporiaceae bacterium]